MGITRPTTFDFLTADLFTYCLGFLMLSMGLTLTIDDFKEVCPPLLDCFMKHDMVPALVARSCGRGWSPAFHCHGQTFASLLTTARHDIFIVLLLI